jgi:hypothetical protein
MTNYLTEEKTKMSKDKIHHYWQYILKGLPLLNTILLGLMLIAILFTFRKLAFARSDLVAYKDEIQYDIESLENEIQYDIESLEKEIKGMTASPLSPKYYHEIIYVNYSQEDREYLLGHVQKALSGFPLNASEFEKAAAINDYVYQYLLMKSNGGTAVSILKDGYALCGGHGMSMIEMLFAIGIRSVEVYSIGPLSTHVMVEARFSDGSQGLFDPTFGVFYYNLVSKHPVSVLEIKANPQFAREYSFHTQHPKRTQFTQPVAPLTDVFSTYKKEVIEEAYNFLTQADDIGLAEAGFNTYRNISLKPGEVLGDPAWRPDQKEEPWDKLLEYRQYKDEQGNPINHWWFEWMGIHPGEGITIAHLYELHNLKPYSTYTFTLHIASATALSEYATSSSKTWPEDKLGLTIKPMQPFQPADTPYEGSKFIELNSFSYSRNNFMPQKIDYVFRASQEEMSLLYTVNGYIRIYAMELQENRP